MRVQFIFWSRCCCCCCVLLLLPTTSVLKRREVPATVSSFSVSATTTAVSFASTRYSIAVAAVEMGCMPEKTNQKYYFFFWWLRCCCFSLIERDMLTKIRLVFAFCLMRVRNRGECDSVRTAALSHCPRFLLPSSLPSCLYVCVLLSTKRHVMLNLTSAAAAAGGGAATALCTAGWSCSVFFSFSSNSLAKATW